LSVVEFVSLIRLCVELAYFEGKKSLVWPDYCTDGKVVTGFQLKVEPKNSLVDDTGLNGIRLFCGQPPVKDEDTTEIGKPGPIWQNVTSTVGIFGYWGVIYNCTTYATGFDLEVVPNRGNYKDDKAATNMKLICGDGRRMEGFHNNGNQHVFEGAQYTGEKTCPQGTAVCGIQTQVEEYQVVGDDTALNNVRMKCCSLSASNIPLPTFNPRP
jgi:hypothetical protein